MDWRFWLGPFLACLRVLGVGVILGVVLVSPYGLGWGDAAFISAELVFCWFAITNALTCFSVDRSLQGLLIPILYSVSGFLAPVGSQDVYTQAALFLWCMPRWWAICYLKSSCTAGVPTFVELRDQGPFGYIRHPLDMSGVLCRVGFAIAHPCWWNLFVAVGCVAVTVWIVVVEERFLSLHSDWRDYARSVRWRLFPGVW